MMTGIAICLISYVPLSGQETQKAEKMLKNTIRINLTSPIISTKYVVVGYERVLSRNHSVSLNIGQFALPKLINSGKKSLNLEKTSKDVGINSSIDFRFYLKKENRYNAPRGVYLAPFYSFNYLKRENTWILDSDSFDGEVNSSLVFNIHTVGGEVGYQFVLWKRLAIDLIMFGPGIGNYNFKANLKTSLNPDDKSEFFQQLNDILAEKFPGYDLVLDDGQFQEKGTFRATSIGYRYMIHIGFRF